MQGDVARRRHSSYNWEQTFDVDEYRKNPKAISMLYEDVLQATSESEALREKIESLQQRISELDKVNVILEKEKLSLQKQGWITFVLQLIAVIFGGFGINLLTSSVPTTYGLLFLIASILLELVAFFVMKSEV